MSVQNGFLKSWLARAVNPNRNERNLHDLDHVQYLVQSSVVGSLLRSSLKAQLAPFYNLPFEGSVIISTAFVDRAHESAPTLPIEHESLVAPHSIRCLVPDGDVRRQCQRGLRGKAAARRTGAEGRIGPIFPFGRKQKGRGRSTSESTSRTFHRVEFALHVYVRLIADRSLDRLPHFSTYLTVRSPSSICIASIESASG